MDDLVVSDPRDGFLIMMNDRLGEVEKAVFEMHTKLDAVLEAFKQVTTEMFCMVLGHPGSMNRERLFVKERDEELSRVVREVLAEEIGLDVQKVLIYHHGSDREHEVTVYVQLKKPIVFQTVERQLTYDLFREKRGCHMRGAHAAKVSTTAAAAITPVSRFAFI